MTNKKSGRIFQYRRITKDTNLDDLNLIQKIIAVVAQRNEKSGYNEVNRIKAEKKYNAKQNELKEDLKEFLRKALAPLAAGEEDAAVLAIDSKFAPVLKNVLELPIYKHNYTRINLRFPKLDMDVPYMIELLFLAKRGA